MRRQLGEVGREEEAEAFGGAWEIERLDAEDDHDDEQEGHEELGPALDALLHAACHDEGREGEEGELADDGQPGVVGEVGELLRNLCHVLSAEVVGGRLAEVAEGPAGDGGVEGEDEECADYA